MATAPPQDQLNISRMLELPAQCFLNKDWSFVHTYRAFMHTHLLCKEKDSPMSEFSGMLGISFQAADAFSIRTEGNRNPIGD